MDENPGETPNPLNNIQINNAAPNNGSASSAVPIVENTNASSETPVTTNATPAVQIDPMNRPMEQAAPAEPTRKKGKVGLIIGMIVSAIALIGGGIAAALMIINSNKKDPVIAAMSKITNGDAPNNVVIDGNINIAIEDELSPLSNINISLNSGVVANSLANNSVATITAALQDIGSFTLEFDEVYAGDGNLYFKLDGLSEVLDQSGILQLLNSANEFPEVIDCGDDDICTTDDLSELICAEGKECLFDEIGDIDMDMSILGDGNQSMLDADVLGYFGGITDNIEIIDGTWLKISLGDLNDFYENSLADSGISCITDLVSDINTNSKSAMELYNKNPFIISTKNSSVIASKDYAVYQVSVDNEKFANFVNSIQNPTLTADLYDCFGLNNNVKITESDVAEITGIFPSVFTEIDDNDNFRRIYLENTLTSVDGCNCANDVDCDCIYTPSAKVTIDLNFSYPNSITISEPDEYMDYSSIIQEIMSGMFDI